MLKNALLVPQRAVSELQGAAQLRIVGEGEKVALRTVTLGARVGSRVIVTEGLEAERTRDRRRPAASRRRRREDQTVSGAAGSGRIVP